MSTEKTHYRKAFDSPYLSSADIVEPVVLTISRVTLESDKSKKTKDRFNTAYFQESEIRKGEKLKPMILNATNSKMLRAITGSPFIDDWSGAKVTVYVDYNVRFGKESVEGLRLSPAVQTKKELTPEDTASWANAKAAYKKQGTLEKILARVDISPTNQELLKKECTDEVA